MLENHKHANPTMFDKMRFDSVINDGMVVIEQNFGSLNNRWHIIKAFNMLFEKTVIVISTYCVLHIYCEI
jgi:hypothetical protein